jgi:hypothetical protein
MSIRVMECVLGDDHQGCRYYRRALQAGSRQGT